MEFVDPIIAEQELPQNNDPHEEGKTEKAVHQLEEEINKAYSNVEKKFGELWSSASKNAGTLQEKYQLEARREDLLMQLNDARTNINDKAKLSEHLAQFEKNFKSLGDLVKDAEFNIDFQHLSSQATEYLDTLDNKLEAVEKQAGQYVSKFASFFSGIVSIDSNADSTTEANYKPNGKETLFSSTNYGSSRFDSDLLKLHTSTEKYLDENLGKPDALFKVDDKTEAISELLEKYDSTLRKVMNELVPVKIPYNTFWFRYFKLEDELKQQEEKRKQLLNNKGSKKENEEEEEEEFTWDDEEEEDAVDVGKEAHEFNNKAPDSKDEEDEDWE